MDQNLLSESYQPVSGPVGTIPLGQPQNSDRNPILRAKAPSCNLCWRRKIKCNRESPCSHCVRSRVPCVSSAPSGAPRGGQGGRRKFDSELLDRIAKLEDLVKDVEGGSTAAIITISATADGNRIV